MARLIESLRRIGCCRGRRTQRRTPAQIDDAGAAKVRSLRDKGITAPDIAKMLGVSRATVYRYLAEPSVAATAK
jgi:AcrR family transcriptional regulator